MTYSKVETILKANDISLYYDKKCILRDINFEIKNIVRPDVKQGQVISLIGRSGIGKTQLFKILAGLRTPSTGTVSIHNGQTIRPGDIGVVFQNYYLFEWRTVYQSLLLAAKQNPGLNGKAKETIEAYAASFHLNDHLNKYPQQLSGGQRQRASIIQQLLKGSDFLLLDEPFSGLDVCVLDHVTEFLLQVSLSDELKTLIIVSHDIETAAALSDTVFILGTEEGKQGATIKKEIDLVERGLAWKKDIRKEKEFMEMTGEIKSYL